MSTPPLTRTSLRRAIPQRCFRPAPARAWLHLAADVAGIAALAWLLAVVEDPWWWPPLWFAQGTLVWALFLIGHDCGHGSFSRRAALNHAVGALVHTPLLVPYHGWRLSHRRHHRHTGDIERDETWFPLTARQLVALPAPVRWLRRRMPFLLFPLYLLRNTPERAGSHFDAASPLFADASAEERAGVRRSARACAAMAVALLAAAAVFGPLALLRFYVGPYLFFAGWLGLVTYLHHTDPEVPWYRGTSWTPLRGALSTVDRHYGCFERVHHDVGSHVAHHLFPGIPHYRLREATESIRPVLGEHYQCSGQPVLRALFESMRRCECVPEAGGRVRYESLAASGRSVPTGAGPRPATR